MAFDVDGIRRAVAISDVATRYGIKLRHAGDEWTGLCPFHSEKTPSFNIFTGKDGAQRFHCFGCQEQGDVIDFVMRLKGVTLPIACEILGGERDAPDNRPPVSSPSVDPYEGIVAADHGGRHPFRIGQATKVWNPKRQAWGMFTPTLVHEYRDRQGDLLGLVLRRDFEGKKETPQIRFVKLPDGVACWARVPFPKPRPLYGLEGLDGDNVVVVEGEKCRDAFQRLTRRVAVSWCGGAQGVKYVDWSPLYGKNVALWADADTPGATAMREIGETLKPHGGTIKLVDLTGRQRDAD